MAERIGSGAHPSCRTTSLEDAAIDTLAGRGGFRGSSGSNGRFLSDAIEADRRRPNALCGLDCRACLAAGKSRLGFERESRLVFLILRRVYSNAS